MKTLQQVSFALAAAVAATGCDPLVLGNRAVVEETRAVPEFRRGLLVENSLRVRYSEGPQSVTVRADSNVLEFIETVVEGGVLLVRRSETVQFLATVQDVDVTGPVLPKLEAGRSATLELTLPPVDTLELRAASSGTVSATGVEARRLEVEAEGSGRVTVSGHLAELHATGLASSTVDTRNAPATRASVLARSGSHLKVRASDEVTGAAHASSRIDIYGHPRVMSVVTTSSSTVVLEE